MDIDDVHARFLRHPTQSLQLLTMVDAGFREEPEKFTREFTESYGHRLHEGRADQLHDAFRTLLCYEYQRRFTSESKQPHSSGTVQETLLEVFLHVENYEEVAFRDIALLQIGLHVTVHQVNDVLNRWRGHSVRLVDALRIAEVVVTGVNLRRFLHGTEQTDEIFSSLATDVAAWFQVVDEGNAAEWRHFVSLLLAMLATFPATAAHLRRLILAGASGKSLLLLCSVVEDLLKSASFNLDGGALTLVTRGLTSPTQLHRKSAQFVLRKVLESNREDLNAESWTKLLLILESLEEKQAHLVLPALTHLEALKDTENFEPWLRCVFNRVLRHSSSAIVRCGLSSLLRLDARRLDDELTMLLVEALNRGFLYDQGQGVVELSALLENDGFLRRLVRSAAEVPWAPIPLFYLFEALSSARSREVWGEAELDAVKLLVERYVGLQARLLQVPTQVNVVKCLALFAKLPETLPKLAEVFSSFPGDFPRRGTKPWALLVERLRGVEDVATFAPKICDKLRENVKSSAILIVLLCDAGKIFTSRSCAVLNSLHNSLSCLVGADKRPYADAAECLRSLRLVAALLALSPTPADPHHQLVAAHVEPAMALILRRPPRSREEAAAYVDVLGGIVGARDVLLDRSTIVSYLNKFREALKTSQPPSSSVGSWYRLNVVYLANEGTGSAPEPPDVRVDDADGRVAAECYGLAARIIHQQVRLANVVDFEELLTLAERRSDRAIPFVAASLELIIQRPENEDTVRGHLEVIRSIVDVCWRSTWDMKRTREFWSSVKQLTKLTINANFMKLKAPEFEELALNYVDDAIVRSENVPAVRYILFSQMSTLPGSELRTFREAILSSLLETSAGRVDRRLELAACSYVQRHHDVDYLAEVVGPGLGAYTDVITRAQLIVLILKLPSDVYVPQLLALLEKQRSKRYFGDSNLHRVKHRILQVLLLLEPQLSAKNVESVHATLCDLILAESDQPSVRMMMEWMLIRIHLKDKRTRKEIWSLLAQGRAGRPGSVTSLASVVYHIAQLLPVPEKVDYIKTAVTHILPSCFSQQFVVRLYTQVILAKLFDAIREVSAVDEYRSVEDAVRESLRHGNLETNSVKLLDNFYFSSFHPVEDYDLQVIFRELPRLTSVSEDEWIDPELFQALSSSLPIRVEHRGQLHRAEVPPASREPRDTEESAHPAEASDALADIQKKIIPPNSEDPTSTAPGTLRRRLVENDTGLIVVASLIDGFPNLGGLARTAEIFCARELVLKSKRYTENREFQSLSVSAEKWIAISEIKPHELRNYLLDKKSAGWTLVGAEQTANSINLLEMKFNPKTILLLGNEKSGIPANLIPLMDTCVEIPQAGVVRSLNVHVTGAICMWQYAQQHIFQSSGSKQKAQN